MFLSTTRWFSSIVVNCRCKRVACLVEFLGIREMEFGRIVGGDETKNDIIRT